VGKTKVTPTRRSLLECRKRGWVPHVVEQTIPHTFIKRDLFGCIDIVALTPDGIVGIQATSDNGGNHAARRHKILANADAKRWTGHAKLFIWSWAKRSNGKRKAWAVREEEIKWSQFPWGIELSPERRAELLAKWPSLGKATVDMFADTVRREQG